MRFPALCRLRKLRDLAAMNAPAGITEADMKAYIHDRVEGASVQLQIQGKVSDRHYVMICRSK